jgi:localization factor PodJL
MNSRASWGVEGIDPSVRERAEAAARRAGMSLSDWLNSTIGDVSPPNFVAKPQPPVLPSQETQDVADIHARLDSITRQIEQISRPAPRHDAPGVEAPRSSEYGVARQLNEAISRLDARLSQISATPAAKPAPPQDSQPKADERGAAPAYRASPPLSPGSLGFAIAEIAARQSELDKATPLPKPAPPRSAPPAAPVIAPPAAPVMAPPATPVLAPELAPSIAPSPDFSVLERHLLKITNQIEALRRPDGLEQSIAAFRSELMEIRRAITEAMPRRAIETIENEIRLLSRRIDETRQSAIDDPALVGIERALGEIRDVLRSLTTAEQLSGYDEAIRNLGAKLDLILCAGDDPSTVQQLEGAIAALRAIVSNVASNDTLLRLHEDVHTLSSKVDQLARQDSNNDSFALLERRIAALTSTLEGRERPAPSESSEHLEGALRALSDRLDRMPAGNDGTPAFTHLEEVLRALSDRIDRMPVGNDGASALAQLEDALRALSDRIDRLPVGNDGASAVAQLEQRVSYLLERLEASTDHRSGNLGRVEEGLQDVLRHLESQHAAFAALAEKSRSAPEPTDPGLIDVVRRELSDIRFSQTQTDRHTQDSLETVHNTLGHVVDRLAMIEGDLRVVRTAPAAPIPATPPAPQSAAAPAAAPRAAKAPQSRPELPNPAAAQEFFAAAPREFHAVQPVLPAVAPVTPRAISEILETHTAPPRPAIAPDLPPDHPLEPGTRPAGRLASPSERIAASESAISDIPTGAREQASTSSFIAAARRAAQAAAASGDKSAGGPAKGAADDKTRKPSTISSKIRSLLVGASVVAIVLGTFKLAMTLLDGGSAQPAMQKLSEPLPSAQLPVDSGVKPVTPGPATPPATIGPATPSMTSPTPIGRQSQIDPAPVGPDSSASTAIIQSAAMASAPPVPASDATGSILSAQTASTSHKITWVQIPATEKLPDAIGGPLLRAAALKGDPTAAYEIGVRFAEGKGVAINLDEAAKWYDRAARAGVVPAVFRLGTLYEKGLSVKKDVEVARRYYLQAAERGNAKAMHNLAVLSADGGDRGADYKEASQWFRKAADHGVADSQFNLGILYARGIGVEQNLAESFKWFSLAAAQGDADAARKRDDIAKRLDAQSLAAARLAIQTFTPELQPDDAINVASPAGGWDSAPAQAAAQKPAAKALLTKRAAR